MTKRKVGRPRKHIGQIVLQTYVSPEIHKALKIAAFKRVCPMGDLVEEALIAYYSELKKIVDGD